MVPEESKTDKTAGQPYSPITPFPAGKDGCGCAACYPPGLNRVMHVCGDCGNKRCPRATHHAHYCTGSNESGQEGSSYGVIDRYPLTAEQQAEEDEFRALVKKIVGDR